MPYPFARRGGAESLLPMCRLKWRRRSKWKAPIGARCSNRTILWRTRRRRGTPHAAV